MRFYIKWEQNCDDKKHDDTYYVLIQRKHRRRKTSFLKETVENADLQKPVLKKTMTAQEQCVKYDFVPPLKHQNN